MMIEEGGSQSYSLVVRDGIRNGKDGHIAAAWQVRQRPRQLTVCDWLMVGEVTEPQGRVAHFMPLQ